MILTKNKVKEMLTDISSKLINDEKLEEKELKLILEIIKFTLEDLQ